MGVTENDNIRRLVKISELEPFRWQIGVDDVVKQESSSTQLHHFQVSKFESRIIVVTENRRDWGYGFQFQDQAGEANVTGMQNVFHPLEDFSNPEIKMPVGVGDESYFHGEAEWAPASWGSPDSAVSPFSAGDSALAV